MPAMLHYTHTHKLTYALVHTHTLLYIFANDKLELKTTPNRQPYKTNQQVFADKMICFFCCCYCGVPNESTIYYWCALCMRARTCNVMQCIHNNRESIMCVCVCLCIRLFTHTHISKTYANFFSFYHRKKRPTDCSTVRMFVLCE